MIRILLEVFKRYNFAQKRIILFLLIGVIGPALALRLFISGDLKEIKKNKKMTAEALKRKAALLQATTAQAQMQGYQELLAVSKNPDWMMQAVHKAAAESGLSVVSLSPQNSEKIDDFEKISLLVEAEGGYDQVGKFVEHLENYEPWIFLNQLRLERLSAAGAGRRLKLSSVLAAYHEVSGTAS